MNYMTENIKRLSEFLKYKGGKGKAETERNLAVAVLNGVDPEKFNPSVLGRVFERDRKTIYDILKRYKSDAFKVIHK